MATREDPRIGQVLAGEYRLTERLGGGGMGMVYAAEQDRLGREVAVKLLRPGHDEELRRRFRGEVRLLSRLQHPHIVSVYDHGETEGGELYLVMERLRGRSLRTAFAEREPDRTWAARVVAQTALALEAAHGEGIAHRDLTPGNIYLVDQGALCDFVKVLDFGLARRIEPGPGDEQTLTRTGELMGTPAYMSPEQAEGERADARSDIYALGVIWYQLVTGENPFRVVVEREGEERVHPLDTLARHRAYEPPAPSQRGFEMEPDQERVLMRMLRKAPDLRPSARQVFEVASAARSPAAKGEPTGVISEAEQARVNREAIERARRLRQGFVSVAFLGLLMVLFAALTATPAEVELNQPEKVGPDDIGVVQRPKTDAVLVDLGRTLYHSAALSGHDRSCASCHPTSGWGTTREAVTHMGLEPAPLNTPTTLNACISYRQTWEARVEELQNIVDVPLFNPILMNGGSWPKVLERLALDRETQAAFALAGREVTADNVRAAIAEYMCFMTPVDSEFDRYVADGRPLSPSAARGYERFQALGCVSCHQGPGAGGNMIARFGVMVEDPYTGRGRCTQGRKDFCRLDSTCAALAQGSCDLAADEVRPKDYGKNYDYQTAQPPPPDQRYMFKVPSLRNVAMTAPYFHDGSASTLGEAIRVMGELQLGVQLNNEAVEEIEAFLETLTGEPTL